MNIRERIVVHRLFEIDGVEDAHVVPGGDQHLAALHDKGSLRVCHHQRGALGFGALHDIGLHEESCFAAAGASDDEHVFVARILRILGPAVHRQPLSFGEDHIVPRVRVDERLNIAGLAPSGGAILDIVPVLLGISAFFVDDQPQQAAKGDAQQKVCGNKAGPG